MVKTIKGRLPHIEISRLVSVLDDSIEKLEILALIPADSGDFSTDVVDELSATEKSSIAELLQAEDQFKRFMHGNKGGAMMIPYSADEYNEHTIALRDSIRDVIRCYLNNNGSLSSLAAEYEPLEAISTFISTLKDLKNVMLGTLTSSTEHKRSRHGRIKCLEDKILASKEQHRAYSTDLHNEQRNKDDDTVYYNDIINKLREDLAHVTQTSSSTLSKLTRDVKDEGGSYKTSHSTFQKNHSTNMDKIKSEMKALLENNNEEESKKIGRKVKLEKEVQKKVDDYDETMLKRMEEIDTIKQIHEKEYKQLEELRAHFVPIDRNILVIEEENKIIEAEEARLSKIKQAMDKAATKIQKIIRGIHARKAFKNIKKRKKGKKGKKGKNGKKK